MNNDPKHPQQPSVVPNRPVETVSLQADDALAVDHVLQGQSPDPSMAHADPERVKKVKAISQLLSQWQVPAMPLDLINRALAKVEHQRKQAAFASGGPRRFTFTPGRLTEFAAMAAIVLIAFSLAVPMLSNARDNERKILCQGNLRQAGEAINAYGVDNQGMLMRGNIVPNDVWWRVGQTPANGQPSQSNSAHLYLLARNGYIDADTLACPDNDDAPRHMTANSHDWESAKQVSYSYQNQYTREPYKPELAPEMAILADKNPMFTIHNQDGLTYRRDLAPNTASRFHRSNGQNVLISSGNVAWKTDPIVRGQDNIWLLNNNNGYYRGNEIPSDYLDSFLVP